MFTGIIESTGILKRKAAIEGDIQLTIDSASLDMGDVKKGDSIAVNGVCLTVISYDQSHFLADVSNETLSCTTLGELSIDSIVNLEKALLPTTRLGGHLVSGHVDGVGQFICKKRDARSEQYSFHAPAEIKKYIAAKGSICIDGISLTVNTICNNEFTVNIVPHTALLTNLARLEPQASVNLEVDVIARYLERLLATDLGDDDNESESTISLQTLHNSGFLTK